MNFTQVDRLVSAWLLMIERRYAGRQAIPVAEVKQHIAALLNKCEAFLAPEDLEQIRRTAATLLDAEIGGIHERPVDTLH